MRSKLIKRICSTAVSALLVASLTACSAGKGGDGDTADNSNIDRVNDVDSVDAGTGSSSTDSKEKVSVSDFYLYVNEDWMNAGERKPYDPVVYRTDRVGNIMYDRIDDMMGKASPEDFAEDDPMYKMTVLYRQFQDENQREDAAMSRIKEMTDYVRSVKNVNQLQSLMEDSTYSLFNPLCYISMEADTEINYEAGVRPMPLYELYGELTEEQRAIIVEGLAEEFEILGYSEAEARRIAENVNTFDMLVHEYYSTTSGSFLGYNTEYWDEENCVINIPTILKANDYYPTDRFGAVHDWFFVCEGYAEWLNKNVSNSNIEMICDFYAYRIVNELSACGSNELLAADITVTEMICGAEKRTADDIEGYDEAAAVLTYYDEGAIADYYASIYVTDDMKAEIESISKDIVNGYVALIDSADWLDTRQKERLKARTKLTKFIIGSYDEYNHLEDMVVEENIVDSVISLIKSNKNFQKRMLVEGEGYVDTGIGLFQSNAWYNSNSNTVLVGLGFLADEDLWKDGTYEEKIGSFGTVIAHELGHAYDPRRVCFRSNGEYDENWEAFWDYYNYSAQNVFNYYDGMMTDFGEPINGAAVIYEAYADIISMQAIMNTLATKDNVDYDLFFTSYARQWGMVSTDEYIHFLYEQDNHVTAHERVNSVLANTNEFYDTYDVPTDSDWYVEEADRVVIFAYEEE